MGRVSTLGIYICKDIIATFGIVGNILILMVLLQTHMRSTFNKLRSALAILDTALLISYIVESIFYYTYAYSIAFPYILWPLRNFAQTASIFMTVVIAVERFMAIHYPLKYKRNKHSRAIKYILSVIICACVLNIAKFFELEGDPDDPTSLDRSWFKGIKTTDLYNNVVYAIYHLVIFKFLITGAIPITVLIYIYAKIYIKFRENHLKREEKPKIKSCHEVNRNKRASRQENMARTFAGVVVSSLICNIPEMVVKIIILFFIVKHGAYSPDDSMVSSLWFQIMLQVRDFFVMINSVINIVIYTSLDKKFRQECTQVFQKIKGCCGCKEKFRRPMPSVSSTTPVENKTPHSAQLKNFTP